MIIYLSGPISLNGTANEKQVRCYKSTFITKKHLLQKKGYEVVCPTDIDIKLPSWEKYMKICISEMMRADKVVVLPDFEKSRGSIAEVAIAHLVGIPVIKIEELS